MQVIQHWPEIHALKLPNSVAKEVWRQLLEPFETEEAAKAFWQEAPSTFIVLESGDSLSQLKNTNAWQAIEFAITYPEYTEVSKYRQ